MQRKQGDVSSAVTTYEGADATAARFLAGVTASAAALKCVGATLGEEHVEHAELRVRLARALAARRNTSRAVALVQDALRQLEETLGARHPKLGEFGVVLAELQLQQGLLDTAHATLQTAIALLRDNQRWLEVADGLFVVAQVHAARRETDQALAQLTQCLEMYGKVLKDEEHPKIAAVHELMQKMMA